MSDLEKDQGCFSPFYVVVVVATFLEDNFDLNLQYICLDLS